jgi:hypothetical protein
MKTITLQVPDSKTTSFLDLVKQLGYAKKVQVLEDKPRTKAEILEGIKEAVEEVKLIRAGKLKSVPLKDFLDEL